VPVLERDPGQYRRDADRQRRPGRGLTSLRSRLLIVLAVTVAAALGALLPVAFGRDAAAPTATRDALAQTERVQGAPGRTMVLSRVTVPPGVQLALHHHLGTQIARVERGALTYTVRQGSAVVWEGESDQDPRKLRTIQAGQTARLRSGQWIVEQPSDVHEAANRGSVPVVLYLATLLKTGAPPSTPVELHNAG
jgi:quercetin dioxygenase-like cupin family protein